MTAVWLHICGYLGCVRDENIGRGGELPSLNKSEDLLFPTDLGIALRSDALLFALQAPVHAHALTPEPGGLQERETHSAKRTHADSIIRIEIAPLRMKEPPSRTSVVPLIIFTSQVLSCATCA